MAKGDQEQGLYSKYYVERLDGRMGGPYFVLSAADPHSVTALRAYAESCAPDYPLLAADLREMADRWANA
ncbi:hypothetical protein K8O93_00650 [Gordonia bronchialis]|nr:hypothetical protein K8O93_00650 [Gordonia bronchialis]